MALNFGVKGRRFSFFFSSHSRRLLIFFVGFFVCLFTFRKGSEQSAAALPGWYLTLTSADQSRLRICPLGVSCRPVESAKPPPLPPTPSGCPMSTKTARKRGMEEGEGEVEGGGGC